MVNSFNKDLSPQSNFTAEFERIKTSWEKVKFHKNYGKLDGIIKRIIGIISYGLFKIIHRKEIKESKDNFYAYQGDLLAKINQLEGSISKDKFQEIEIQFKTMKEALRLGVIKPNEAEEKKINEYGDKLNAIKILKFYLPERESLLKSADEVLKDREVKSEEIERLLKQFDELEQDYTKELGADFLIKSRRERLQTKLDDYEGVDMGTSKMEQFSTEEDYEGTLRVNLSVDQPLDALSQNEVKNTKLVASNLRFSDYPKVHEQLIDHLKSFKEIIESERLKQEIAGLESFSSATLEEIIKVLNETDLNKYAQSYFEKMENTHQEYTRNLQALEFSLDEYVESYDHLSEDIAKKIKELKLDLFYEKEILGKLNFSVNPEMMLSLASMKRNRDSVGLKTATFRIKEGHVLRGLLKRIKQTESKETKEQKKTEAKAIVSDPNFNEVLKTLPQGFFNPEESQQIQSMIEEKEKLKE